MLSESIDEFRDRVAIEWKDIQVTYDELETRVNQIASRLISARAGQGHACRRDGRK